MTVRSILALPVQGNMALRILVSSALCSTTLDELGVIKTVYCSTSYNTATGAESCVLFGPIKNF